MGSDDAKQRKESIQMSVKFIRKNGRIIAIKQKPLLSEETKNKLKGAASAVAVGAAIAGGSVAAHHAGMAAGKISEKHFNLAKKSQAISQKAFILKNDSELFLHMKKGMNHFRKGETARVIQKGMFKISRLLGYGLMKRL